MPILHPAPQTVALNTDEGYIINPVSGDSIQPVVNSLGYALKTGMAFPAKGKAIHPGSLEQPKRIPAGEPEMVPTNLNVHKIPETLTVITINKNSLKIFPPGVDTSSFVHVNSTGDTADLNLDSSKQRVILDSVFSTSDHNDRAHIFFVAGFFQIKAIETVAEILEAVASLFIGESCRSYRPAVFSAQKNFDIGGRLAVHVDNSSGK